VFFKPRQDHPFSRFSNSSQVIPDIPVEYPTYFIVFGDRIAKVE